MIKGHEIFRFDELSSTHLFAMEHGEKMSDGAVVSCNFQSGGRGRLGRTWYAPPGEALLFSMVLKPSVTVEKASLLTPILSIAIAKAIGEVGLDAKLRWPNDVVAGGKKIAGVLAEARMDGGLLSFAAVGAGINVNQDARFLSSIDRPATSLFAETGVKRDPDSLLVPMLESFDDLYGRFMKDGFEAISPLWRGLMVHGDETIALDFGSRIVQGRVRGFGDDGSIEIEEPSGFVGRHLSGEVVRLSDIDERNRR